MENATGHRDGLARPLRARFVMERHLGHQTYADNLRDHIGRGARMEADWYDVAYEHTAGWWEDLPIGAGARGALRGRHEVLRGARGTHDVTFFNTQVPAVLGGRRGRGTPYVLSTDITPRQYDRMGAAYGHRPDRRGPARGLKHLLNMRVFRNAARCVGWSTWVADSLMREYGVDPALIEVIPPGVDVDRWRPATKTQQGPVRVLFVGGDFQRKGGPAVLRAFRSLPFGSAELTVVTRSHVPTDESVTVLRDLRPNSAALIELVRGSDVFMLPSSAEAFGIAAVEASACGLPVIASPVGGLPDVVQEGVTGYLVRPDDVAGLSRQLRRLVLNATLRSRFGSAARQHVVDHFDAARNAQRLTELLQNVVEERRLGHRRQLVAGTGNRRERTEKPDRSPGPRIGTSALAHPSETRLSVDRLEGSRRN